MSLAFLRSLGAGENPVEEAKVHLRKAKLIFDLGKNTLALARLPKDYEVSRNILGSAKNHLDEAGDAIAKALREDAPVEDVLPLYRSLSNGILSSMTELSQVSSGLGGLGTDPTRPMASKIISFLTQWVEKKKSLREVAEKAEPILEKVEQAITILYPEGEPIDLEAEDLQRVNWLLTLAERETENLPIPLRQTLQRSIRTVSTIFRDAIESYSLKEKIERAETAEEVIRKVKEFQETQPKATLPPTEFERLRSTLEASLLKMSQRRPLLGLKPGIPGERMTELVRQAIGVRFKKGPSYPMPTADDILTMAEGLISRAEMVLTQASKENPQSVKFLKEDFKAADLLLRSDELIRQSADLAGQMRRELVLSEEEIAEMFPKKGKAWQIEERIRLNTKYREFMNRLRLASLQTRKLSAQSGFLRKILFGLPWFQPPAKEG